MKAIKKDYPKVKVATRKQAISMTNKWKEQAPIIFENILETLGEEA